MTVKIILHWTWYTHYYEVRNSAFLNLSITSVLIKTTICKQYAVQELLSSTGKNHFIKECRIQFRKTAVLQTQEIDAFLYGLSF